MKTVILYGVQLLILRTAFILRMAFLWHMAFYISFCFFGDGEKEMVGEFDFLWPKGPAVARGLVTLREVWHTALGFGEGFEIEREEKLGGTWTVGE